jgi:ATP-dependent DNA helicase RecG
LKDNLALLRDHIMAGGAGMTRRIPVRESLTVEFKSDRERLPDRDLVAAVICLANTDGGEVYVGVEKDGAVTGLHPSHQNVTGVIALIANQTNPPLTVRVEVVDIGKHRVAKVLVPKSRHLVATAEGLLQRRRLKADGTPECVPLYPHEITQRQSDLGLLDYSALPMPSASIEDFDPLERERLRQCVERYGGDRTLLGLADDELVGALGLVRRDENRLVPTVAGILILGKESTIREHLPTHEVAFQVLEGTEVRVNEFRKTPLLKTFEWVDQQFGARLIEKELQAGLFRVPVPNYDPRAFREAFVNALVHRDYTRLGAVHVRWEAEAIVISNPGGFVEGVTLENLLVVEPRPRNTLLADAIKRIGLAERTGRGIDLIYQGLLRYGRPAPDYRRSDSKSVVVILPGGEANVGMLQTIIEEEERLKHPLPVDSLIALSLLRQERRVDTARLAHCIQKDEPTARQVIERLVEAGLVEAHGVKKGRTYTLSPKVYQRMGQSADYVRQAGFDAIQQEQMVLQYVQSHGRITRKDAAALCRISEDQASRLLRKLSGAKKLKPEGKGRGTSYVLR